MRPLSLTLTLALTLTLTPTKANREQQRTHYKERMDKEKKQQNRMYRRN